VIDTASFMVVMPLTFISNAFVPLESFPNGLRTLVEWNPVLAVTQASRELFGNTNPDAPVPDAWSMQNPILYTLIRVGILVAVFAPLSIARYRRTSH